MSEAKRVTLTTISTTVSSSLMTAGSSSSLRFGGDFLAPADKSTTPAAAAVSGNKGAIKSIRLNVELFQTDSTNYPEFNYTKLLHIKKKKIKKLKQKSSNGFSDPFEDNDDDVARIAEALEKKYGNAYSAGRGKNKRDDVDIGMGYDESDSFIDNTEAYDELIPDEVETVEGGFYINCGALEFKKLHNESMTTKTDELIKMPNRPKKRVISSSSEESSSSSDEEDDDSDDDDDDDDDSAEESTSVETAKSKSSTTAATTDKKPKSSSASTTNPAKKKAISTENGGATAAAPAKKTKDKNLTSGLSLSASNSPKPTAEELILDAEKNAKKVEKTTTVKDMLKAQRDNFLKSQTSNGDGKGKSSAEDEEEDDDDSTSDDSENEDDSDDNSDSNQSAAQTEKDKKPTSGNEDNQGNEKLRTVDTNLPELEADVLSSIVEFKDDIKSQNITGKKFQFNDKLSESFLKIDDSLLCLDKTQRNMVFAHLEYQLSLPKYYFLRKAKQLRIKEEKLKSKRAFSKLHKAITETMPAVIASYDAELRRFAELQAASLNSDQPPKMPKKKFPWNANIRNLLYEVYQVRWTSYPVLKTRKETLEEFITSYMRDKVVEIWPKGWIRYEELQKEIEKRKTAAKKAKEKKKTVMGPASGQSSPNPSVTANPTATIQISSVSSLAGTTATTATATTAAAVPNSTQPVSFMKQFEEFASRSNANSDTESVASSGASSGLKRKNTDAARNKPTKSKAAKLNGEQTKSNSNTNKNIPPVISVDLSSPTKRTDHSINHIMSPTDGTAGATTTSAANSIFSATTAAVSQPSSKHSNNTHVIDLDNYKSVGDILQTSKQLQAAANAAAATSSSLLTVKGNAGSRRESSGDSEIEFIGIIPAKIQTKKNKTNSRSATPTSSQNNNNNNNNNNSNNSKKKSANSGLPAMDVKKIVNSLMEQGDEHQIKSILTSTAQQQKQQNSQSSTMSQSGGGLHQ